MTNNVVPKFEGKLKIHKKVPKKKNLQREETSSFEGTKIVSCGFSFLPICSRAVENKADEVD